MGWRERIERCLGARPDGIRAAIVAAVFGGPSRPAPPAPSAPLHPEPAPVPTAVTLPSDQVPEGEVVEVSIAGQSVALCRVDGQVYALEGICPHAGGALGDGELDGHELLCPLHGWPFDVRTGACGFDPEIVVDPVPVHEDGDTIRVGS